MPSISVDISAWSKRNLWRLPSGELAVRPGMRKIVDVAGSAKVISPGTFTIRNDFSGGEVWHYFLVCSDSTQSARAPTLFVMDENFVTVQDFAVSGNRTPRIVTFAVVQGQIIIASPDFQTLWGLVGSGVTVATKATSDDTSVTSIEVPQGICTAWAGSRVVIASGRTLFVSDPVTATGGSPRTFVGENQMELPGVIYGLHEAAGGMLVAVTDVGVYGLDSSAASTGIVGEGGADWRLLNHHSVSNYGASCVVRGRVWALTQRGIMLVDMENNEEIILNEPMISIGFSPGRYAMEDFRTARVFAGDVGPIIGCDDAKACVRMDVTQDPPFISWLKTSEMDPSAGVYGPSSLQGTLTDVDGTQILAGLHGIYRPVGDFDGTQLLSSFSTQHTGSLRGAFMNEPAGNMRVRHVHAAAACGGGASLVRAAYRGVPYSADPGTDQVGIIIGTDSWGTTTKHYTVTPLSSVRFDFGTESPPENEMTFEVGADGGLVRIVARINVDFSESAIKRPSSVG